MEEAMKRFMLALAVAVVGAISMSGPALADRMPSFKWFSNSHKAVGTVLESYPVYASGGTSTERVCKDVKVPIYAGGANAGDIAAGAIIGGVLGNIATGNKAGTTAGAVLGGVVAADQANKRTITGYRIERQCEDVQVSNRDTLKYYESRVRLEGRVYLVRTTNQFRAGQNVTMWVSN
jgi:uncharacterized protein YcfJ